ncbi:phage portal protein [Micromonospora globispora]|uniref:phage portal protein n=1 Tax=Micromonospora globispora TaxID=1450148 RepID=UPI000F5D6CEA|nr:phage portal protein [Micromonospora globispora]RQW83560.1 hypothetical protein DKL51_31535 [Micromonospora globispora]
MGWIAATAQVVRDALSLPRPLTLDQQPQHTFDTAPQPVDRLISAMRAGTGSVTRDEALSVAAVQRGRNEICSLATLPLKLFRGLDVVDSPLFRQYDPDVPNVVHLAMTVEDLALERIAWWQVTGQDFDGYPVSVRRIDPGRVELKNPTGRPAPDDDRFVWIRKEDGSGWDRVPASLMKRFDSPNPGILKANARAIRIARRLDELTEMYASNPALREYFTDSDSPDVDPMDDDEIDAFLAEYGAMRRVQPYGWIPSTVKRADVSSPSPRDLTLVELHQTVMVAIANGLGVDPEDIGVSTTSRTYQNEDARRRDKINRMFAPYMRAITDRLGMGDITRRGYTVQFDLTDYLKPDPQGQAAYWKALKDMGVTDADEIRGWAGLSGRAPKPTTTPAVVPATSARFAGDGPVMRFSAQDFADAPPAPTVDKAARTITGLAVPYNAVANKLGLKYSFKPGSLEYSDPARMAHLKDHVTPVGFHRSVKDTPDGPLVELAVLDGPEGSPAKAERDQLLYDAEHGLYSGLSIGVDFSLDPEVGDVEYDAETGVYNVLRATWRETSTTYMPAFDDARVTTVAASLTGGPQMDPCQHCGQRHAPGIACATFAAQLRQPAPPAPAAPAAQDTPVDMAAFRQMVAAFQAGQPQAADGGPTPVSPHRGSAQVKEPQPYVFDRQGNLRAGSHDFSTDLFTGWQPGGGGDQAARDRAEGFLRDTFEGGAANQFAITPANVTNLNYPANRTDMYVDQMEYQYPIWNAINKGTLDAVTPFVVPKFNTATGLVADHVTGTEPTPGTFTATAQTITPSAVSGKVEITREAFDQGGNPQMSGLIWRQMTRGYFEALEAYAVAQLAANAASMADLTITTAAADSTLDQSIATALIPLQYIRGGDRFKTVFTQVDLYTAMAKAKDGSGRRLYPAYGPQNAAGTADPGYAVIDAHGKRWIPAWATAATSVNAASSYMFDPEVVCGWASAPQRIDLQWRVAWVDLGVWGYKAFAITDFARTRELVYDPV